MDLTLLKEKLTDCLKNKIPVLMTLAVMGSTEESAVDPLSEILDLREEFRAQGLEFNIHAITEGIDALGEVTVRIQAQNGQSTMDAQSEVTYARVYGGHGADTDILVASAKAYINALNKLHSKLERVNPQV